MQDLGSCLRCPDIWLQHGASSPHELQLRLRSPIITYKVLVASPQTCCSGHQS